LSENPSLSAGWYWLVLPGLDMTAAGVPATTTCPPFSPEIGSDGITSRSQVVAERVYEG